eukprot:776244_1
MAVELAAWILLSLHILVFIPLCIYAIYVLHTNWDKSYFVRRRRKLTRLILICCCIVLTFSQPAIIILTISYREFAEIPMHWAMIPLTFTKFSYFACSMLLATRTWLYYFDIMYTRELSSKEWKSLLNDYCPDLFGKQLWYTTKRHSFGCDIWCSGIVLFITLFVTIAYNMVYLSNPDHAYIFATCIHALSFIIPWAVGALFIEALIILNSMDPAKLSMLYKTAMYFVSFDLAVVVYVSVVDIDRRFKKSKVEDNIHHVLQSSNEYKDVRITSWKPIVQKMDGYALFMNHLQREFCVENLLFVTEYSQFKQMLIKTAPNQMETMQEKLVWKLDLPPSAELPLGSITCRFHCQITETETSKTDMDKLLFDACNKLYEKYIKPGATFEINISSSQRYNIIDLMKNDSGILQNILPHLEQAVLAIEMLMNDSFSRFRQTPIAKEFWARFVM